MDDFGGVSREGEEFTKKPSGGLKAKLDAKGLSGVEPVERFFVGHWWSFLRGGDFFRTAKMRRH